VLLQHFWWGSVFLLGVPVMCVLLVAGPLVLPEHCDRRAGRLDLISVVLLLASMLPIIYGVKGIARDGLAPGSLAALVVGITLTVVFVRRQQRRADPLLDVALFTGRNFSAALVILMLGVATQAGTMFLIGLYLQLVRGLSPLSAGLWILPASPAMIAGSLMAPLAARWVQPRAVVAAGMTLAAGGFAVLTQVDRSGRLPLLVVGLVCVFFGIGAMATLSQDLVVGAVPPQRAGSAAAISQTSGDLGIALGIALLGAGAAAVYRTRLPAAPTVDGTIAGGTVSDAVSAARNLPPGQAAALLDAAFGAFTTALHVAVGASAVVAVALAVLAAVILRPDKTERPTTTTGHDS
jgi:DHA2 family multidrug resistance protein-like MFS transporter